MEPANRAGAGPVWTRIELTTPASEVELLIHTHAHTPNRCSTANPSTHEEAFDATCFQSEELTLDATGLSARESGAGLANMMPTAINSGADVCGSTHTAVDDTGGAADRLPVAPACATDALGHGAGRAAAPEADNASRAGTTTPLCGAFVISGEQLDVYATGTSPLGFSVFALTDGYKLSDTGPPADAHDLSRMWAGRSWCDAATIRLRPGEGDLSAAQRVASRTRPRVIIHPRSHSRVARDLDGRRVRMYAGSDVVCDVQLERNVTALPAYSNGTSCSGSACPAWIVPLDDDNVCSSGVRWRDPCERFSLRGAAFAEPNACEANSSCEVIVLPDQPRRHGGAALCNPGKPAQWCDVIMDRFDARASSPACNVTMQLQDGVGHRHSAHLVLHEVQSSPSSPQACFLLDAAPSASVCAPVSRYANEGEVRLSFPGTAADSFIVTAFNPRSATKLPAWRANIALPWDASVVDVIAASTLSACRVRYKCLAPRAAPPAAASVPDGVGDHLLAQPASAVRVQEIPGLASAIYIDQLTILVGSLPVVLLLLFLLRQWLQRPPIGPPTARAVEKEVANNGIEVDVQHKTADSPRKVLKPSPSLRIISPGAGPPASLSRRQAAAYAASSSASSPPLSTSAAPAQRTLRKTASIREYAAASIQPQWNNVDTTARGTSVNDAVPASTVSTRSRRAEIPQRRLSFASPTLRSARFDESDEA